MRVKLEDITVTAECRNKGEKLLLPVFKLKIKDVFHYFIVDTGAEHTMLAPDLIASAYNGMPNIVGGAVLGGVGSRDEITPIVALRMNLLGVYTETVGTVKSMFDQMRQSYNRNISGLIGQDVLRKFKSYTFDNVAREIEFNV